MHNKQKIQGVTLIEVLLVLAIASVMLFMFINYMQQKTDELRRNRTSLQIQQILNAGLAYYVVNNRWPASLDTLKGTYLPPSSVPFKNPWGKDFIVVGSGGTGLFYVYTDVLTSGNASIIAGRLPLSYISNAAGSPPAPSGCTGASCYIVSGVNIPGQNLNNATAVNFAGMYHSGACVPAPKCPVDKDGNTMTPQIFVAPSSVSGVNDPITSQITTYPISSFVAYARGDSTGAPVLPNTGGGPLSCATIQAPAREVCNWSDSAVVGSGVSPYPLLTEDEKGTTYWRVCLKVGTEKGTVAVKPSEDTLGGGTQASQYHGKEMGTVLAFTRCTTTAEDTGSNFQVWTPDRSWSP